MAELTFEPESHTYRIGGIVVPSVTQVIDDQLNDWEGVPLDAMEAARIFGAHVHEACHLMVRDELDWDSLDPELFPYVDAARRFIDESGITIIESETRMCDPGLMIAGTEDIWGIIRDDYWLLDWKTPLQFPRSVGPQTAAYSHLRGKSRPTPRAPGKRNKPPHRRGCVQLNPKLCKNGYKLTECKDSTDWHYFLSARNCFRFKHRY